MAVHTLNTALKSTSEEAVRARIRDVAIEADSCSIGTCMTTRTIWKRRCETTART